MGDERWGVEGDVELGCIKGVVGSKCTCSVIVASSSTISGRPHMQRSLVAMACAPVNRMLSIKPELSTRVRRPLPKERGAPCRPSTISGTTAESTMVMQKLLSQTPS